jgi:hypothetical protein
LQDVPRGREEGERGEERNVIKGGWKKRRKKGRKK